MIKVKEKKYVGHSHLLRAILEKLHFIYLPTQIPPYILGQCYLKLHLIIWEKESNFRAKLMTLKVKIYWKWVIAINGTGGYILISQFPVSFIYLF